MELTVERSDRGGRVRILAGTDDGAPFRVRVPMRCRTTEAAIEWLRPPEVPPGAPRQGDLYFVPMVAEHRLGTWKPSSLRERSETDAGSWREVEVDDGPLSFGRHEIEQGEVPACKSISRVAQARGETCFIGRKSVRSHAWTGRPRYFVRGTVVHPEHGTLVLGLTWHEVIRNRAAGPWPVRGLRGGD